MKNYIDEILSPNEAVLYRGKVNPFSQIGIILIGVLALPIGAQLPLLGFLTIGFLPLIFGLTILAIRYYTTELVITDQRVIAKFGFIARSSIEIKLMKIESIQVNQSILGRVFNYGTILVSGAGNPLAPIPWISHPLAFRRACLEAQEKLQQPKTEGSVEVL